MLRKCFYAGARLLTKYEEYRRRSGLGVVLTGFINILKPPGMTSFDVVAWLRRLYRIKKIGHCGTLDPDAAGVLPVCVGAATGAAQYLTDARKAYRVEVVPGLLTDTLDVSGNIIASSGAGMPERSRFEAVMLDFTGRSEQVPPMFSAIKIDGRKLYKLARKGLTADVAARPIEIFSMDLAYYSENKAVFDVECSKGAYVRALCRDMGDALDTYFCMSFLLRTMSAGFTLRDALTLEEIERLVFAGTPEVALTPVDGVLTEFESVSLNGEQRVKFMNGAPVTGVNIVEKCATQNDAVRIVRVYHAGIFLGLGNVETIGMGEYRLKVKKFLM